MEINKYQQAYQNVQAELPVDNEDIVVLRELVEKSIPKKPRVIKVYEDVVCYECPNCNSRTPTNFRKNYCDVCGQKLDWREEND